MSRLKHPPFTDEVDAAMIRLRADGLSWQAIAAQLGQNVSVCRRRYMAQHGPQLPPPPFTDADDALMLQLRLDGQGWRDIGQRLGRDHTSCLRHWDRIGGKRRLAQAQLQPPPAPDPGDRWLMSPFRNPLPVGHPVTWGAIALPWQQPPPAPSDH